MKFRIWLGTAVLSTMIIAVACQSESPVAGGERVITTATHLPLDTPEDIAAALDVCNDDGTGQGQAAKTRFENAIKKLLNGDTAGAQSDIIELLGWEYDRYDLGKWQCGDEHFVEIMEAMVASVSLDIPIALDGCVCLTDGCTCISNTDCGGVTLPNPNGEPYFISFVNTSFDPFVVTPPGLSLYDQFVNFQVVDINGDPVEFPDVPATVTVFVQDLNTNLVTEEQLRLFHVKEDGTSEILPLANSTFSLSCTDGNTASNSFFDQVASIFRATPLYGSGSKSGLMSSFSPVGPADPHSDTQVGISPTGVQLTDGQSQIFTATVEGVETFDTAGNAYEPTDLQVGSPIEFYLDDGTDPFANGVIDANGQASVSLTCGSDLDSGVHEIRVVYPATDTHAASSTEDDDSPTGPATVTCTTPFNVINFDRDPNDNPLKNGEVVNNTYASLGVYFSQVPVIGGLCQDTKVYAVSDPNTGHFGSPPRVVSLCEASSPFSSSSHGWVKASFNQDQSEVCVAVFPTAGKGKNVPQGKIVAYALDGSPIGSASGQGKLVCVAKKRNDPFIRSVHFSGDGELAKFDNLRYR